VLTATHHFNGRFSNFFLVFSNSPGGQNPQPITRQNGLNDADLGKNVPFGGWQVSTPEYSPVGPRSVQAEVVSLACPLALSTTPNGSSPAVLNRGTVELTRAHWIAGS